MIDVMLLNADEYALAWLVDKAREGQWCIERSNWPGSHDTIIAHDAATHSPKDIVLKAFVADLGQAASHVRRHRDQVTLTSLTQLLGNLLSSQELFDPEYRVKADGPRYYRFGSMQAIRIHLATHVLKVPDYFAHDDQPATAEGDEMAELMDLA